jgi:hypothetical protein
MATTPTKSWLDQPPSQKAAGMLSLNVSSLPFYSEWEVGWHGLQAFLSGLATELITDEKGVVRGSGSSAVMVAPKTELSVIGTRFYPRGFFSCDLSPIYAESHMPV